MNETNSIPLVSQFVKWSDELNGLPAWPLVVIGCIMAGYFLKLLPFVNNRWIPACVVVFGVIGNMVITPTAGSLRAWAVRSFIMGMTAGVVGWVTHRMVLKRWLDPKMFGNGNTDFISNGKPPAQ